MDPIDDIVRDAMKALEGSSTPRDYFEQLPDRINVRLEGSMQTEHQSDAHSTDGVVRTEASEENSGLHDIKALAHSTKTQVARRRATSQHEIDSTLLSHAQSGLHAVALPDPAKMVQLPSVEEARALARTTHGMAAVATEVDETPARTATPAREPVAARSKGLPVWLWAGGGLAAAAAAVMAFVVLGKDTGKQAEEAAAPSADQVAREEPAAAAAGSAAPTVQPLEEKAAEPPPMADQGITTSGIAADPAPPAPEEAKAEDAPKSDRKKKDKGGDTEADPDKAFKKDSKVKPDDKADDVVAPPKDETKKDVKKTEAEKKLEGAVLGDGDSDELGIGDALGGGEKKDEAPKKTELTNQEVRDGLDAINGKAKACYGAHGQTGTVKVKLTIAPSGKVSKATASGDLAGTPAGDCVVSAVKSAEFPAWDGAPKSTSYVVLLSD